MTLSDSLPALSDLDSGTFALAQLCTLHERYFDSIWRYVRRLGLTRSEADDVAQQAFVVVAEKISRVEQGSEKAFLYAVALRLVLAARRGSARQHELREEVDDIQGDAPDPETLLEERRARETLDEILAAMTLDLRVVFVLFEIEELTMLEIARILHIPQGTVASRLRRARADFQELSAEALSLRKGAP
jgi:RNA polymerase sigma-70 factor (ECF subfamily)